MAGMNFYKPNGASLFQGIFFEEIGWVRITIMKTGEIIEKVKMFADKAHGDQMRKFANERYIVHPIRVMEIVRDFSQEIPLLAASLLHDVLEDTSVTKEELKYFLDSTMSEEDSDRTLALVNELTDVYTKTAYPKLNRRSRRAKEGERLSAVSADAQTIKYADVIDNVNDIASQQADFVIIYMRECKQLLSVMPDGNPELYQRAIQVIEEAMKQHFSKANIKAL